MATCAEALRQEFQHQISSCFCSFSHILHAFFEFNPNFKEVQNMTKFGLFAEIKRKLELINLMRPSRGMKVFCTESTIKSNSSPYSQKKSHNRLSKNYFF